MADASSHQKYDPEETQLLRKLVELLPPEPSALDIRRILEREVIKDIEVCVV